MSDLLESLRVNSEFISQIQKLKHIAVGLLENSIINAVIPPLALYIYMSSSLTKYIAFMMVLRDIEKKIGTPNFLKM